MPDSNTTRLVLQVDAAVALAQANMSALARSIEADTKKMDGSLARVDAAHARLARASGSSRIAQMEFSHVITASTDALSAGIPIQRVFAMEMGRIMQAAQFAAQGEGAFAKLLNGPWGIAMQVGVSLLAMLAMHHGKAGDAADAQKDAEGRLADAMHGGLAAADALAKAIGELRAAEDRSLQTEDALIDKRYRLAEATLNAARANKTLLDTELATAQQRESAAAQRQGTSAGHGLEAASGEYAAAHADVERLQRASDKMGKAIEDAAATMADEAVKTARKMASNVGRAEVEFDRKQRALEIQFRGGNIDGRHIVGEFNAPGMTPARRLQVTAELVLAEEKLRIAREAAIAAARKLDDAETGRSHTSERAAATAAASLGDMVAFLKREIPGVRITSTNTGGHVAGSDHYRDRAIDFVPAGGVGSMTKAQVRELFESNGIRIRRNAAGAEQLFGPGDRGHSDHFHIAWEGGVPSSAALDRRAATAQDRQQREQQSFEGAYAQASARLAAAQAAAARNTEESVDLQIVRIGKEREALDQATHRQALDQHWNREKEASIVEVHRQEAAQRVLAVVTADQADMAKDQLRAQIEAVQGEEAMAHLRAQLADTTAARRESAMTLLELSQKQERLELQSIIETTKDNDERDRARARLGRLDDQLALGRRVIDREHETPGQRYRRKLQDDVSDIGSRLEEVKMRGLQGLEDELVAVVSGTESVASAFKRMTASIIADLARIAIEREIIMPLANMLFGGSGGGGGAFASMFSHEFGGGFAAGGDPPVGKWSLVGERGPELVKFKTPATVIPNHMLGRGGGGGVTVHQEIHIDAKGGEIGVEHKIAAAMAAHAPGIAAGAAQQVVRMLTRPRLN
jgi:hypothetical protein